MNRTIRTLSAFVLLTILAAFALATGQEEKPGQPAMSPEEQAMMEKWQTYMTPGPEHLKMARFVGSWNVRAKLWMQPGTEPQLSEATAEVTSILGDRFLQMTYTGSFMGMPFEGRNLLGYDNYTKKYTSIWFDSMGTGFYLTSGTCDDAGKVCTETGIWDDAVTEQKVAVRTVTTWKDKNTIVMETYSTYPDTPEFKSMELFYTRR
ncbi:MAG TPA: DUF1579 domain-containing protein [Thermoanaerobaculia bacterium]|nr:DUF1579 domain-containing protein [Thermoanaerobaculia bacterium]HUM29793.1 DUF1579 domain-containing protein [Thermoanaerobaculia bacterium]HXK68068.1 DUF1579 domain-containing protein [Thermoanaerobaculia bacterium]